MFFSPATSICKKPLKNLLFLRKAREGERRKKEKKG
jgi:hypothetical protein